VSRAAFPRLRPARGARLSALAVDLACPRAGFWEGLPWIGDWLLRRRIRRTRIMQRQAERRVFGLFFQPRGRE
jgi:hypothetical protein